MKKHSQRLPNLERARGPTAAEVIDRILDKGIVIEYRTTRALLSGIDLPATVDTRGVTIAPLDTYVTYAERLGETWLPVDVWLGQPTSAPAHSRPRRRN